MNRMGATRPGAEQASGAETSLRPRLPRAPLTLEEGVKMLGKNEHIIPAEGPHAEWACGVQPPSQRVALFLQPYAVSEVVAECRTQVQDLATK